MQRWTHLLAMMAILGLGNVAWSQAAKPSRVGVEDSPEALKLLSDTRRRLQQDEPEAAARLIQEIFDKHGRDAEHHLLVREKGLYAEAHILAGELLTEDLKLGRAYRQLFDTEAQQVLEDAGDDIAKLGRLLDRFALTSPGLLGGLRLAALSLERAESGAAAQVLERCSGHPALGQHRTRWLRLSAIAALMNGRPHQYAKWRKKLDGQPAARALDQFAQSLKLENRIRALTPLDVLPAADASDVVANDQWTVPQSEEAKKRYGAANYISSVYNINTRSRSAFESRIKKGGYLNVMPLLANGRLFVNDGRDVWAVNPASGRQLWTQKILDDNKGRSRFGQLQSVPYGIDLNCVAHGEGHVLALCGFGSMTIAYYTTYLPRSSLLACLDEKTGKLKWSKTPEQIDPRLNGAFWYGRPFVIDGRAIVTARQRQRTGYEKAYVLSIDLKSGKLNWRRHLATYPMINSYQYRPDSAHMLLRDGYIYVDSRLGTISKLSADDGSVYWMTVVPVRSGYTDYANSFPWHATAPVLTESGLLVLDNKEDRVRLYDTKTGKAIHQFDGSIWGTPDYLVPIEGDVLAVGPKAIRRYDGTKVLTPKEGLRWTVAGAATDPTLVGRVAITADRLYMPTAHGVHIADLKTGKRADRSVRISKLPANVLALEGQLVLAHQHGVSSYTTWPVAFKQLSKQAVESPDDPFPLLALIKIAYDTGRQKIVLETLSRVEAVIAKSNKGLKVDRFNSLLTMARQAKVEQAYRENFFTILGKIHRGQVQEVRYRLELGRHHATSDRLAEAIDQYQSLLADRTIRQMMYQHDSGSRTPVALEARTRLKQLLAKHGAKYYKRHNDEAKRRFTQFSDQTPTQDWVELAEAYPMSSVAVTALHRASIRYLADTKDPIEEAVDEAVALLERAEWWGTTSQLAQVFGFKTQLYERAGRLIAARAVLKSIPLEHDAMKPIRDGQPVEVSVWIKELEQKLAAQGIAGQLRLGLDTRRPVHLEGRLLVPAHTVSEAERPPLFILLGQKGQTLDLYHTKELKKRWSQPIAVTDTRLIALSATRAWVWQPKLGRLELLTTAAAAEAAVVQRITLKAVFGALGGLGRQRQAEQLRGENRAGVVPNASDDPFRHKGIVVATNGRGVAVTDEAGRLAVFNHHDGRLLWKKATPALRVAHLHMSRTRVVVSGIDMAGDSVICVYNIKDAALQHQVKRTRDQPILWMRVNAAGLMVFVTPDRVEGFDLRRGQSLWTSRKPNVQFGAGNDAARRRIVRGGARAGAKPKGIMGEDRLMLTTTKPATSVVWVDLTSGAMTEPLPLVGKVGGQVRFDHDGGLWLIRGDNRCLAYDGTGKKLWHDAVTLPILRVSHAMTEQFVVMFSSPIDQQAINEHGDRSRVIYLIKRSGGLLIAEYTMPTPGKVDRVTAVGGRLLIASSTGHATMVLSSLKAVPAPKEPAAPGAADAKPKDKAK
jgi:outer membrane protein assembly factor BamB